ncbi:hypothetical protein [Nocardiopsis tropica]|uniref:Uncharacterized protein n=1 Tax=Nocardiopsis tropica TaxID=109330 RepID=A0ABU7KQ33_9ACTN|nr:hypothetical protein [Nocardiopsis umidischolae]MEE2050802.1 hypothetical protein [Nocardiopsis umidischolae]
MSPAPVSVLLCALLLGAPPQSDDNVPPPCAASAEPADPTEPAVRDGGAGDPDPCASPSAGPTPSPAAGARPAEASVGSARRAAAAPPPVHEPVVRYTAEAAPPATTFARAVGHTSTVVLVLLGIAVLAMRLSVGWPRFPTPYLGQRRFDREEY